MNNIYKNNNNYSGDPYAIENFLNSYYSDNKVVSVEKIVINIYDNEVGGILQENQLLFCNHIQCMQDDPTDTTNNFLTFLKINLNIKSFFSDLIFFDGIDNHYSHYINVFNNYILNFVNTTFDTITVEGYIVSFKKNLAK